MTSRLLAIALFAAPLAAHASFFGPPTHTPVDVVVDFTPEGRKLAHPDGAHRAYYLPVVFGFKEWGAVVAGEKRPNERDLIHLVAAQLANQGYFVMDPAHGHPPSLILAIHYGCLNPENDDMDPTDTTGMSKVFFNEREMLALVAGNTLQNLDLSFEREDVMQAAEEDRYFVALTAFDFEAFAKGRHKVPLWQAKMSVPSAGISGFADVMEALVKAGGPFLGRETLRPKMILAPVTPEGRVEIGTPTVKDYSDAPTPPRAKPAK
jgi:hypothetical protein